MVAAGDRESLSTFVVEMAVGVAMAAAAATAVVALDGTIKWNS